MPDHIESSNNSRSTLDKVEEIGLLAVSGAWEHIKNYKTSIAVKAVEGIAIGAAIMTAPVWVGVLNAIPESVGSKFNGHGMAKYSWLENLASLKEILTKGVDKDRVFHEMPLRGSESYGGAFGADRPFDTGPFILLGKPGQRISDSGVHYVLVNDHFYGAIPQLQAAYPHVEFIKAKEAAVRLAEILAGKKKA